MQLLNKGFFLFDEGFPLHTWYPVLDGKLIASPPQDNRVFDNIDIISIKKRALYFHIPFCEGNICSFCSFPRKIKTSEEEIEEYVESLIKEIEIKSRYNKISSIPIHSIFFGGGTPSILNPSQIRRIGKAIRECFNLENMREFSFENNLNSINEEKLLALKDIGVTHVRAGVQTLNKKYRDYFNLLPTIDDVYSKLKLMKNYFENVCIDIIYGINGQTIEELMEDIHLACSLDTKLIDFYPLTQPASNMKLSKIFGQQGLRAKSELELIGFSIILKEVLQSYGYQAHNGHGFIKYPNKYIDENISIDHDYCFEYHKCTMGYDDGDVVGFGAGAASQFINYTICNTTNITEYVSSIKEGIILADICEVDEKLHYSKALTTHLPYFGYAEKNKINFNKISEDTSESFNKLLKEKLIFEDEDKYYMRKDAWYWDNVLMYYLSPKCEKDVLEQYIINSNKPVKYKFDNINLLGRDNV